MLEKKCKTKDLAEKPERVAEALLKGTLYITIFASTMEYS